MTDSITGIDVHRYNGQMDYPIAYAAGARFVLARCGGGYTNTGLPFTDSQWENNVAHAPPVIPCFGAWWYLSGFASTVVSQANYCADLLIPHKEALTLGFWLDCEWWSTGIAPTANRDLALRFIDTFQALSGIPVRGIYTRQSIWDAYVAPSARLAALDLWAARYSAALTSPWSDGYYRFRDWQAYKFWQFSADGNGLGQKYGAPAPPAADADIDLDRWALSLDDLYAYAGIQPPALSLEQKVDRLWAAHPEIHPALDSSGDASGVH